MDDLDKFWLEISAKYALYFDDKQDPFEQFVSETLYYLMVELMTIIKGRGIDSI